MNKFCPFCGEQLPEESRFCSNCGSIQPEPKPVQQAAVFQQNSLAEQAPVVPVAEPEPVVEPEAVVYEEPVVEAEPAVYEEPVAEPETAIYLEPAAYQEPAYQEPEPVVSQVAVAESEYAVPDSTSEPPKRTLKDRIRGEAPSKFGRQLLACLVCVLIFLFATVAVVILNVRTVTTEESLAQVVGAVDLEDVKASDLGMDSDKDVLDWAIDQFYPDGAKLLTKREKETLIDELKNSGIMDYGVEMTALLLNDLYTGGDEFEIREEDIEDLILDNKKLMILFGEETTRTFAEDVATELVDGSYNLGELSAKNIVGENDLVRLGFRFGLSYGAVIFLGILAVLCFVLLLRIQKKCILSAFNQAGITLVILSLIFLVPTALAYLLTNLWETICGGNYLIATVSTQSLTMTYQTPLILLGTGVVMILVPAILRRWAKK